MYLLQYIKCPSLMKQIWKQRRNNGLNFALFNNTGTSKKNFNKIKISGNIEVLTFVINCYWFFVDHYNRCSTLVTNKKIPEGVPMRR